MKQNSENNISEFPVGRTSLCTQNEMDEFAKEFKTRKRIDIKKEQKELREQVNKLYARIDAMNIYLYDTEPEYDEDGNEIN